MVCSVYNLSRIFLIMLHLSVHKSLNVYKKISMCTERSLCSYYNLYVYSTISMLKTRCNFKLTDKLGKDSA